MIIDYNFLNHEFNFNCFIIKSKYFNYRLKSVNLVQFDLIEFIRQNFCFIMIILYYRNF